mmetsp:Transcript_93393/g.222055  ORF Transcript_93393/g.222055 Transcript_93393/m.222055 type:complete len:228 (-) Transcript_93393:1247-1930(-)
MLKTCLDVAMTDRASFKLIGQAANLLLRLRCCSAAGPHGFLPRGSPWLSVRMPALTVDPPFALTRLPSWRNRLPAPPALARGSHCRAPQGGAPQTALPRWWWTAVRRRDSVAAPGLRFLSLPVLVQPVPRMPAIPVARKARSPRSLTSAAGAYVPPASQHLQACSIRGSGLPPSAYPGLWSRCARAERQVARQRMTWALVLERLPSIGRDLFPAFRPSWAGQQRRCP